MNQFDAIIIGAAILGTGGDEAIHGILNIMNAGVPYEVLERAAPSIPPSRSSFPSCSASFDHFRRRRHPPVPRR
jgi:pyruvate/2-oxoglutarate dehydrogenase complex dihydrolipoamide dehydrogenase (E3) component